MKVTPALKKELAQWLDTYWTTYLKGDIDTWATFIRDDYRNIGGTKEEIWNSKQEILDYTNSILDQMLGAAEIRNREIEVIPYGEYMMVNEFTDLFVKAEGEWTLYGPFRMSSLLEKTDTGWIALHQHGSYPDMKAMEGEAFSMDAVKAENAKLMEMVKIRTAELEIEAALERVRAVAMGMKKPEDMLNVCRIISDQLQQFGVSKIRNVQTAIIDESIGQYLCYQFFPAYDQTTIEDTDYHKSPVEQEMVREMLASRDGHFIGSLIGERLEEFISHRKEENHFPDPLLDEASEVSYCFLSIGEGGLGMSLYQPMDEQVLTLFKRFHQVFSLAYQRFRDIEKAEAQAREAQIEVAVEKVRAQSMAMHHPDDLDKVNKEILTQLNWLQIQGLSGVTFYLVDQDGWVKAYDFSSPGNIGNQNSYTLQFDFKKYEMMGFPFQIFQQTDLNYYVAEYPLEKLERAVFEIEEINPEVATVVKEALAKGILTHQWTACARITDGVLGIDMISPPSEDTKTIVLKIAGAFNQAYQRFLDLQKAEAQAREAEIELALERVRARTMAMHSSEDVGKCIIKMFSELTALGVDEGTRFGIGILNHDNENNQLWTARKNGNEVNMHIGNIDMTSHPLLKSARKAWKEQVPLHKYVLEGEDLLNYYQMLNNAPDYKIQIPIDALPKKEIQHCFIFEYGFFYAFTPLEFQPELIHITKRFSSLFEQTYRRYLDLVRAENQAKEAEIELKLERVRARTMAMHHTEELKEVIQVVFDQFVGLKIHVDHAGFILDYKKREDMHIWLADHQQGVPTEITFPYFNSPHWNSFRQAKAKQESFFANLLPFEVKNKFYQDLFELIPDLTEEAQQAIFGKPGLAISTVLLDNVGLYIEHYSETPFSVEENAILMRFGKVFQQTYTRFLDLQKAEVQTREAQIQLSLERIRAKALAMQHSDELNDFLTVLFEQFDVLNLNPVFCHLSLLDIDNNRCTYRMTGKNGARLFTSGEIDLNISTVWDTKIEELKSGKPREVDVMYFPNESILEISSHVKEMLGNPPENELPQPEEFPDGQYVIEGYCKYGYLGYSASRPPSDEEKEITKRIANEFGNVYQRFLDLQKAEELARESEIELALERIRARTIGMQKSEELTDTAALVFHQIEELGIHQWGNAFQLWDDDMKLVTSWTCTHGVESLKSRIHATEDPVMINIVKAAQRGENLYVEEMGGEALENHYKFLTSLPVLKEVFEKLAKDGFKPPKFQVFHAAYFKYGYILFITQEPYPDAHDIFIRFAKVFEQTYTRFLDLEKAEAQAREAKIEAALERVRSKTMAMHNSLEVGESVATLFEELSTLGLLDVNDRCGIGIMQPNEIMEAWTAAKTPDGKAELTIGHINMKLHPMMVSAYGGWLEKKEINQYILEGEDILSYYDAIRNQSDYKIKRDYFSDQLRIVHTDFYFNEGCLYVFSQNEFSANSIAVFLRFVGVFGQTYRRYLDLRKAEAQAREAQIEAALERVRSRTMGMQHSSELTSAATLLFQQIQTLGVPPWSCGFNIWEQGDTVFTSYMGSPDGAILEGFKIPLTEEATFIHFKESRDRGDKLFVDVLEGETLEAHYSYFLSLPEIKKAFENRAQAGEHHPTFQINHLANFSHGNLMFITYEPCPQAHDIFIRFAKVFEQTYTRFLDLQKAEAQAREAEVQLALERVRARSLAMHHSEELADISLELVKQVQTLGMESWFCAFNIYDDDPRGSVEWGSNGHGTFPQYRTPREGVFLRYFEAGQRGETLLVNEIGDEECHAHYEYLCTLPGVGEQLLQMKAAGIPFPTSQIDHVAFFKYGYVLFITYEPAPESHDIFKRFANVFEQSYTRFLDLQKAEAQAMEAQIEAALEKVRSRSMAMHNSQELKEVALELRKQMGKLGQKDLEVCAIHLYGDDEDFFESWSAMKVPDSEVEIVQAQTHFPKNGIRIVDEMMYHYNSGSRDYVLVNEGEKIEEWFEVMKKHAPEIYSSIMYSIGDLSINQIKGKWSIADFSGGALVMVTYGEPDSAARNLLRRSANVFEQAYVRFLDLQKAEAQAREAQIQLALERVRARTMSMQKSQELPEAANLLFQQIQSLGMPAWSAGYCTWKEDLPTEKEGKSAVTLWMSSEGVLQPPFTAPTTDDKLFIQMREGAEKGKDLHVVELGGEELEQHYRYMRKIPVVGEILDSIIEAGHPLPTFQIMHQAYFSKGFLLFITYESVPESYDIFKRFAKVFDQTYTRFLDLQKAEAQAREAQIANALEKVRSRSLAMQSPDELIEVAKLLREEMGALGVEELETSSIYIQEDHSGSTQCWFTIKNPDNPEKAITDQMTLDLQDTWVGRKMDEFVRSKATQTSILMQGEQRIEWIRYCEEKTELFGTSNFYGETIPDRTYHLYKFSNGYIGAAAPGEISTESWELLKRATAVFSFAYTRFRDLQMAQSSARAAMRQASLDRIRADISSMRNADDLGRITPLVFNELTTLGIPFIRCGVFIVHENKNNVEIYLSTPEGKSLAVMTLPFSANEMTSKSVEAWKKGEVYVQHWNQTDFINWGKSMQEQGYVKDLKTYQGADAAPESLHLHFVPFAQGLLYVGSTETLSEEQIDLVKALAKSFAIAYARYEDFVKLEQAKSAVESAMNELKATQSQLVQQEKLASLGQLTAGIAHEIKNPLNFVNNFSEVSIEMIEEVMEERSKSQDTRDETLVDEILEDIKSNLQKVHEHGTRANGIVTSMLQHSRGGSGKMEPTNLNSLIKEYVNLSFHGMRANKNPIDVDIQLELEPSLEPVSLIKEDFTRVVINLCNNAFDAMRGKKYEVQSTKYQDKEGNDIDYLPKLRVSTTLENGQVRISFEDNGPGIPDEIKDKILQPFFTTKKGTEGTGLGLSITHDIIKAHGGELRVESPPAGEVGEVGGGTVFTFYLPNTQSP